MSYSLSKQIAHCYFRAWKCGELAARSINAADRQVYGERKQAWLTLARSYEFSERLGQMLKEMQKQGERSFLLSRNTVTATKLPKCPTCNIEMQFLASQPIKQMFVQATTLFERAFFICPNCRWLSDQLIAMPSF